MAPFEIPCKLDGWMVIQRRQDGSESFTRHWQDYKDGFGNVEREFFIGLEKLYQLTNAVPHELYIKLGTLEGVYKYAHYNDFKIGSEQEFYELKALGNYSGSAGDSLIRHKNKNFSTFDRNNDPSGADCAEKNNGGWWFANCFDSALNGKYHKNGQSKSQEGVNWYYWNNDYTTSFTFVEMMIRPNLKIEN
ncbi:fibrinogen-like protein 1 [Drosophila elegans]|uniref:fibrinogen-like protein 1 n=1 Tax=Drosophila elegans TaxID=30023 RepID=UPI001BC85B90|nr:fibrinogen-like protein 1 [Drosophila elegans]